MALSSEAQHSPLQLLRFPQISIARLRDPLERSLVIQSIRKACQELGYFRVVDHGISESVLEGALSSGLSFFGLPAEEKRRFLDDDIDSPVRYYVYSRRGRDGIHEQREFLKHYSNPLEDFLDLWPQIPPCYREKMGTYVKEVRKLAMELLEAINESLGLDPTHLKHQLEEGMHMVALNYYPPCSSDPAVVGMQPHTDHGIITLLLENSPGLQVRDEADGSWRTVPGLHGSLIVNVGDHLEVLSNGLYKSVVHRAVLSSERTRLSVISVHNLGIDEKIEPAEQLVDHEQRPRKYKGSSVRDFTRFLINESNSSTEGKSFIESLKI